MPSDRSAGRPWLPPSGALVLSDLQRRLHLALGERGRSAAAQRMLIAGACGAATGVLGVLALLGRGLGGVVPLHAKHPAAVAEVLWPLAVAHVLLQLMQARPEAARQLARPADRDVLRSLGATSGQVLLARLVLPAAGTALATALGVTALIVPWLGATAEGRALTGPLLVHLWGCARGPPCCASCSPEACCTSAAHPD